MKSDPETLRKQLQEAQQREQNAERLREEEERLRERNKKQNTSVKKTGIATNTELERLHCLSFSTLVIPTSV